MKRKIDVEEMLMRFRYEPGSHVKSSVMNRFDDTFGGVKMRVNSKGFWRMPVPMYAAVVVLLLAAGLSFFAGLKFGHGDVRNELLRESSGEVSGPFAQEVSWYVTENDLL